MLSNDETPQMSMVPPPDTDAELALAASLHRKRGSRRQINPDAKPDEFQAEFSVIGEKQFKNPLLFPPPSTKDLDKPRKIVFSRPDDSVQQSVTILGNNVTAGYTTVTLSVIAVVNDMWKDLGRDPEGWVVGSYAEVARRLQLSPDNPSRNRKLVKEELERLKRCQLVFSNFYTEAESKKNSEITYFQEYFYEESKQNPSLNRFKARIHPYIVNNLQIGHIASLPLRALLQLKNDNSKPVLLKVDSALAVQSINKIELSATSILELLVLDGESQWYRKPSTRLKVLTNIQTDIDGKELSSGWKVNVTVEPVTSGGDYKLVFTRGARVAAPAGSNLPEILNTDQMLVQSLVNAMIAVTGETDKEKLYAIYARSYPEDLIYRVISEFKADKPPTTRNNGAFFTQILSRVVLEMGYQWVN